MLVGYRNIFEAGEHLEEILSCDPIGLEGIDQLLVDMFRNQEKHMEGVRKLPDGSAWLFVEFGGDSRDEAVEKGKKCLEKAQGKESKIKSYFKLVEDPEEQRVMWDLRESSLGVTARSAGDKDTYPGWEDAALRLVTWAII